jgi:putative flippase GtrA
MTEHPNPVKKSPFDFEIIRYFGPALVCAVINNIIYIVGDGMGYNYVFLTFIAWLASGTVGYLMHARITFRVAGSWSGFAQFMIGVAVSVPAALAVLALFKSVIMLPMWAAAPAATATMFVYHYVNARLAIRWRGRKSAAADAPGSAP